MYQYAAPSIFLARSVALNLSSTFFTADRSLVARREKKENVGKWKGEKKQSRHQQQYHLSISEVEELRMPQLLQ